MIEIKCLECKNCTGDSCKVYGSDADKAVKSCTDDSFRNYKPRMTRKEAAEIIKIERECVERNTSNECDRDCINCDLLRADEEIFSAYDMAIKALQEPERKRGRWIEKSKWQSGRWVKWFECSNCGEKDYNTEIYEDMPFTGLSNFCPNCGADIKGEHK